VSSFSASLQAIYYQTIKSGRKVANSHIKQSQWATIQKTRLHRAIQTNISQQKEYHQESTVSKNTFWVTAVVDCRLDWIWGAGSRRVGRGGYTLHVREV